MATLEGISGLLLRLHAQKQFPMLVRSISSATLQRKYVRDKGQVLWHTRNKTLKNSPIFIQNELKEFYSITSQISDNQNKNYSKLVKELSFQVPSFGGSVWANSPIDVTVKSADPCHHQNLDKAFVRQLSCANVDSYPAKFSVTQEGPKLDVQCNIDKDTKTSDYKLEVEVPIIHNVKVSALQNASVDVHDFIESNYVHIIADKGQVRTQKIKTEDLTINTISGDVICQGSLQGNIKISSSNGNIISGKSFLGPNLELETEEGDIRVSSSYSDQAKFSTNRGSMNLRNIHNESYVAVYDKGDVKMMGVDGSTNVFVKSGYLDVHISRIRHESRIHIEQGDIHLKLSDTYPLKLSIDANDIVADEKFSEHAKIEKRQNSESVHLFAAIEPNQFSPTLIVVAENGSVVLETQDWATSFGFGLRS